MQWNRLTDDAALLARRRPADELLRAILEESPERLDRVPSLEVGRLLQTLAGERAVRRVLEVGTGLGFVTVCLARGAAEAEVVSIDRDERHFDRVGAFLERAGVAERVRLASGELLDLSGRLEGRFDLLHLAVAAEVARRLVDRLLPQLEVGGLLTVENLLPAPDSTDEAERSEARDGEASDRARAVAGYLVMHPQLDCSVLPIGGGLAVARKTRPTVTEMGGPF
ncbi:MAG: class I SAM-dependent methyltransferase [Thermoanaerobaculia bacterium]|nr:class I SAM-dependent methyltransferase [Thermoanaerobaculia bacterium]